MADLDDHAPEDIPCGAQVFDIDFHPSQDVLAIGSVTGVVEIYKYGEEANVKVLDLTHHQDSCRAVCFGPDGQSLYTASKDRSIRAFDTSGSPVWAEMRAHEHPVNRLYTLSSDIIASGDDEGCIKIWDTRQHRCVSEWKEHTDFISAFTSNPAGDHLLATGGDGRLSVYDLRKNVLAGKSDDLDDELLSVSVVKNGKKVVCGSQDGVLVIFSWGTWGDMSDRFPGHPESVESILRIDDDTILTGSSDGIIRVVQLHPNKLLGLIGDHEDFPIEILKLSHDHRIIGSVSHTNKVHFWDVGYLFNDDDDGIEDDDEEEEKQGDATMGDDREDDNASDSDSDSDMETEFQGGRRPMPSAREAFFSDL